MLGDVVNHCFISSDSVGSVLGSRRLFLAAWVRSALNHELFSDLHRTILVSTWRFDHEQLEGGINATRTASAGEQRNEWSQGPGLTVVSYAGTDT